MKSETPNLGRLEKVQVREAWPDEARHFTPWLARKENIELLGETIGLELEVEAVEEPVGPFRADILCKDTVSHRYVLVENQLDPTDHSHLGQTITYAAGLDAVTLVWIAERFREEHRAAIDWLNSISENNFHFFGLEVELWKIGDSQLAPKFNVVSKPNDWSADVTRAARSVSEGDWTELQQLQYEYWEGVKRAIETRGCRLRSNTRPRENAIWFGVGNSAFGLAASVHSQGRYLQVRFMCVGDDRRAYFELLRQEQDVIDREIGEPLEWDARPHRKECWIALNKSDTDYTERDDWSEQHAWIAGTLEKFDNVFRQRIGRLDASDYEPDEDDETESQ